MPRLTGERIVTAEGRFNASWHRHAACYALSTRFLSTGSVLDIGCGTGHAQRHLRPRRIVGIDRHVPSLADQSSAAAVGADMRCIPFRNGAFSSVVCIHAIEHIPDPTPLLTESRRILAHSGTAVFVTPNRLTFGRPDEVIDPYHFVEYDAQALQGLCQQHFSSASLFGLFGSPRYMELFHEERERLARLLRYDPLRLRRFVPRRLRQIFYDGLLTRFRLDSATEEISIADFELRSGPIDDALDLFAVCRR